MPKKSVLMISTMHEDPDIADDEKQKPEVILYYNEQKCGVDMVN